MNIVRELEQIIKNKLYQKKAIVVVGPRQVGKTTLLNQIYDASDQKILFLNCDEPDVRKKLELPTSTQLKALIGTAELILVDEAQRVKDIGIKGNIERFPEDFMFQLNEYEWNSRSSQFVMTSKSKRPTSST